MLYLKLRFYENQWLLDLAEQRTSELENKLVAFNFRFQKRKKCKTHSTYAKKVQHTNNCIP